MERSAFEAGSRSTSLSQAANQQYQGHSEAEQISLCPGSVSALDIHAAMSIPQDAAKWFQQLCGQGPSWLTASDPQYMRTISVLGRVRLGSLQLGTLKASSACSLCARSILHFENKSKVDHSRMLKQNINFAGSILALDIHAARLQKLADVAKKMGLESVIETGAGDLRYLAVSRALTENRLWHLGSTLAYIERC
jgi:hypothetical protein